ncbi:MAG: pilin [bacterium]
MRSLLGNKKNTALFLGIFFAVMVFVPLATNAQLLSPNPIPGSGPIGTSPDPFVNNWSTLKTAPDPTNAPFDPAATPVTNGAAPTQNLSGYCQNYSATPASGVVSIPDLLKYFTCTLQRYIVPLLLAIGLLLFVYGMVQFISSSDAEERAEGRQFMIWGVVGFAVIFSVWGILTIFNQTFRLNNSAPTVPTTNAPTIQG